jgi:hypothetical protein
LSKEAISKAPSQNSHISTITLLMKMIMRCRFVIAALLFPLPGALGAINPVSTNAEHAGIKNKKVAIIGISHQSFPLITKPSIPTNHSSDASCGSDISQVLELPDLLPRII